MLVARRNVMMIADEHLGAIRRGAVRVLAVNGERGSGRTAVLHELFERARRSGIDVELISTPDTRLPPIDGRGGGAEDVRTADARTADVVAAIAPGAGTETTDGVGADVPPDLGDVVDRAVEHLRDQRRPRAVLIDDVDRRPPADIDVVERLVVALGAEHESTRHGLMIVLTAAKPLAPDIAGHYRTMRSLRSWYSTELAHLDESHIADLCVRAGVVPDPLGVVLPIARRSGGIAGQVALLVEQERRRPGAAAAFDGDFAELAVTTARARTADLAASAIDVAEVAALAVEPVGLELLVDVLGRDAAELAPVCEDLTGRGVLRAAARDTWTVADVAVANVVVSAIDQRRAVQLHADLAAHLDARARDRSPPAPALEMRRARHLLAAADLVAASDRLHAAERAGRTAMRHHDWPNAASFAEAALGLCAPGDPLRPELLSLAGTVHHWNADLGRAVERFEELIGDDATVEDGTSDNALRDNALRDNALRGSALRDDAVLQLARIRMTNDPASVVAPNRLDVARLTRLADEHGDRRTRCLALDLLSEVHAHAAHTHEALAFADRAVGESRPMDDARLLGRALIARGLAELTAMEPHRARATYRLVRRLAAPADWLIDCWATTRAGLAALLAGDLAAAARLASEASALAAGRRLLGDAGLARAVQAAVAVCQGDLRAAGRLLDEATHFARRSDYHVILH
ncbi:MAG: ATP-binding protein, partial [Actinomycetota bacterium]|nr:ATP-binding protein [Actinomycetota bacterium]